MKVVTKIYKKTTTIKMESYHTTGIDKKKEIKEMVIDLNNDLNGNHNSMSISGKLFQDGVHICSNAVEDILKEST